MIRTQQDRAAAMAAAIDVGNEAKPAVRLEADELASLESYVAERTDGVEDPETLLAATRQAKGEWLLSRVPLGGDAALRRILAEIIRDVYSVDA